MRPKWIAGLIALCLVTAIAASILTVIFLFKGNWGNLLLRTAVPATTTESKITSSQTASTASPSPTKVPTPEPNPTAALPSDPNALETLYLWQPPLLLAEIYKSAAPSVAGIKIEAATGNSLIPQTNEGSGLIIDKGGYIVTNASILNIALDKQGKVAVEARISVLIYGISQPFTATLTGRDTMTGLAVLKIDPGLHELKSAKMAGTPDLEIGQLILALGYPDIQIKSGGLSSGIICGINQTVILEDGTSLQMIQTNARVSQTSSGGPVLNLNGEVIGLSNYSLNRDSSDTLSYALPTSTVLLVAQNLIKNGFVSGRSWLGVAVLQENGFLDLQKLYFFPDGLYISNVFKDSPAYSSDLRKGDIITKINNTAVKPSMDLGRFLQSQPIGALVTIEVYRRTDGKNHEIKVYLQEYRQ